MGRLKAHEAEAVREENLAKAHAKRREIIARNRELRAKREAEAARIARARCWAGIQTPGGRCVLPRGHAGEHRDAAGRVFFGHGRARIPPPA